MGVKYPEDIHTKKPGAGLNIQPLDIDVHLDFDSSLGKGSGILLGLIFKLPKLGFERVKVDDMIVVSPTFQQYYQITLKQKEELEAIIKAGLASIATALSDLELLKHDFRKYKEFMDYYKLMEEGKKKKDERMRMEGERALKSIFIDQVDSHTDLPNTPIALRSIAGRWPTIIADFMKLTDEDLDPKEIAKKYNISEAEANILATKNKLYLEWRDELFKRAVEERFRSLLQLVEARRASYEEYKQMIKPTLRRYKSIVDGLQSDAIAKFLQRAAFWRPGVQPMSIDSTTIWAWKPFAVAEKFKTPRERPLDEIPATKAGFTLEEVEEIKRALGKEELFLKALPVEPSIDEIVRELVKEIKKEYKVEITALDIYNAREKLVKKFEESAKGATDYEPWVFSPYYIFLEIPVVRAVIRLPNGTEIEDLMFDRIRPYLCSQNVMIARLVELEAKDKELDNFVKRMLGEAGLSLEEKVVNIEKLEKEYLIKTEEKKEEKKEKKKKPYEDFAKALEKFSKFFGLQFFRAKGPYEFHFQERITKYYLTEVGGTCKAIINFIKSSYGVP